MTHVRVELAPELTDDLDRIVDHLLAHDSPNTEARVASILAAFDMLAQSPEVGRPLANGLRELIIGRGSGGFVALYRYVPEVDVVFVLAVRAQREAGYAR